ncbi:MAG: HIT domain-containing protein [Alphaproteobacteria bacterium]|nr:HIT domain-containing protein [Alphaproteobacteria bacterium]
MENNTIVNDNDLNNKNVNDSQVINHNTNVRGHKEYNKDNIFYKIINKQINSNLVLEGKHFIAINDIRPKAPVHVLIIPKGNYIDYDDFVSNATDEEIVDFNKGIAQIIEQMKLLPGGYKLLSNSGIFGQQEVPHMHVHILGKPSN